MFLTSLPLPDVQMSCRSEKVAAFQPPVPVWKTILEISLVNISICIPRNSQDLTNALQAKVKKLTLIRHCRSSCRLSIHLRISFRLVRERPVPRIRTAGSDGNCLGISFRLARVARLLRASFHKAKRL